MSRSITIAELTEGLGLAHRDGPSPRTVRIADIADDSRAVTPGSLFIARPGPVHDGGSFIADALRAGASAVIAAPSASFPTDARACLLQAPDATADTMARLTAELAERFFGEPSSDLTVLGVTGTNGKTTTSVLLQWLIGGAARSNAPSRCGLISTVAIDAGPARAKAVMTTPGAIDLSRALAEMVGAGRTHAVVETSSHALDQRRVAALNYQVGVFTNLTGDHLDYHKTIENYADAKARLFEMLPDDGHAIVNHDDPWSERMLRDCPARITVCSMGAPALSAGRGWTRCRAAIESVAMSGMNLALDGPWGSIKVRLPLIGAHNAMNALQAAAAAFAAGVSRADIAERLAAAPAPPGRLEPVTRAPGAPEPFAVLVDYAHTDDALTRVMSAVKPLVAPGASLTVVFGCGGDRDRTKRPRMGAAVAALADRIVVTSDNPRTEDPSSIIEMVLGGIPAHVRARAHVDPDRESAVRHAVASAQPGDIVLIAGKGHEDYQILPDGHGGTVRRDFDDRLVARAALTDRFGPVDTTHAHGAPA